jgi:xylulokinase
LSYLGLDIGTGGCKAVIFHSDGRELASAFREYSLLHPHPDHAELDPDEVIRKCFEVIAEANKRTTDPVLAMAISSQGEAFTPVDMNGNTLANAMVSSDIRAKEIVTAWSKDFGAAKIYRITGHTPHTLFTLYKILWIKAHRPDIWKKARHFLCFEDLFLYRLGLEPRISWPLAGRTMLFDVMRHQWSRPILDAAGLDAGKLAVPAAPGEITGVIPQHAGRKLGFRNPVTTVAGISLWQHWEQG